jgi:hypothetical protein
MPLLVFENTRFNYGVNILLCESRIGGRFSLLVVGSPTCKSNMLFHLLRGTIKFMIAYFFQVPASNNLVECVLAPPRICLFFPCK